MKNVLLILAGTKTPDAMIEAAAAIAKKESSRLIAVYILEPGKASEVFDTFTDIGFIGDKPTTELSESLMKDYRQRGYEELGRAQMKAMELGVDFEPDLEEGDYVSTALDAIEKWSVGVALAVRPKKKHLINYFSKTPLEDLIAGAPCEVMVFDEN